MTILGIIFSIVMAIVAMDSTAQWYSYIHGQDREFVRKMLFIILLELGTITSFILG